jgi:O-antigen ligase/thioredoxin-like negative regulator of GroEL
MNKIIPNILIGGIGLLLLTPLIVTESLFFPFITGKAFYFRLISELLIALWLFLLVLDKSYRPHWRPLVWAMSGFMAVLVLATLFGINPVRSLWSNFERMEGLVTYLHLFGLFLVASSVLKSERAWQWLFRTSVAVSVIVALRGLCQLAGSCAISQGGVRLDAFFGNATYLAVYMLLHIFVVLWLARLDWQRVWTRWVYLPLLALQLIILYHTATRGAILGLLIGSVMAGVVMAWRGRGQLRRWSLILIAIVVLLAGGVWLGKDSRFVQSSPVLSRFAAISATETTTDSRLTIWQMTLRGAQERPILGWGPENFLQVFSKYYEPKLWRQEPWFDHSHNIYLDWLIHAGVLGLAGYLSLFGIAIWYLWRREKDYVVTALFTGLLSAYAINNFFVFDNLTSYILFFLLLAYIHHRYEGSQVAVPQTKPVVWPLTPLQNTAAFVLVVALGATLYVVNWQPYRVAHQLLLALQPNVTAAGRLDLFKSAIAANTFGTPEAVTQLFGQAWGVVQAPDASPQFKQEFADFTIKSAQAELVAMPDDIRTMYTLGSFFLGVNQPQEAIKYLTVAQERSPRKQTIIMDLAAAYFAAGDKAKALELAKSAYDLDSNFANARLTYGLLLFKAGQTKRAEEIVGDAKLDERFINAYAEVGDYKKVLALWQEKVAAEPDNVQARFSLAAAYFVTGNKAGAIKELTAAGEIATDPQIKANAAEIIRRINNGENPLAQ